MVDAWEGGRGWEGGRERGAGRRKEDRPQWGSCHLSYKNVILENIILIWLKTYTQDLYTFRSYCLGVCLWQPLSPRKQCFGSQRQPAFEHPGGLFPVQPGCFLWGTWQIRRLLCPSSQLLPMGSSCLLFFTCPARSGGDCHAVESPPTPALAVPYTSLLFKPSLLRGAGGCLRHCRTGSRWAVQFCKTHLVSTHVCIW